MAHVALLVDAGRDLQPAYEVVPARDLGDGVWEVLGTPALAEGCAAGDWLLLQPDGSFTVVRRSGNLGILVVGPSGYALRTELDTLRVAFAPLGGLVESHPDGRWLVVTVPVHVGFASIEDVMGSCLLPVGSSWTYTNVYDADDRPLGWWSATV